MFSQLETDIIVRRSSKTMNNDAKGHQEGRYKQMKNKTKSHLIEELAGLRQRIIELEARKKQADKGIGCYVAALPSLVSGLASALGDSIGLSAVARIGLDRFLEATDLHAGVLYLINETSGELFPVIQKGINGEITEILRKIPFACSAKGKANNIEKVVTIMDTLKDKGLINYAKLNPDFEKSRFLVRVLLKSRGKAVGVIYAGDETLKSFSVEEICMMEAFGGLIGIAIEHSELIEKMSQISVTDELTGLFNRRHFEEALELEIYRSHRYGSPFSLAIVEFDGFRKYLENFGQTRGERVLKGFAHKLKTGLRKTDVACRYSDDMFYIMLPETDAKRSRRVIESIRLKFAKILEMEHLDRDCGLSLNAGIVEFPQVSSTTDGLVCMASCALYYARIRGGNRSVLISEPEKTMTMDVKRENPRKVKDIADYGKENDFVASGRWEDVAIISELIGKTMGLQKN